MSKFYRYIFVFIMIIILFVQITCINIKDNEKNINVYNTQDNLLYHKTLNDLNEELNCLKEKNIISANKINNTWYLKIKLNGNKEELLSEISKLKNYNISDYTINKNKDESSIILEISAKEIS